MENVTIFVDNVGRMIVGAENDSASNKTTLAVDNPAVVNIQADQQTGNISVQLLPFVFSEFVTNKEPVTWKFARVNVVTSDNIALDTRIIEQYDQIVNGTPPPANGPVVDNTQSSDEPEVIKLFDE